MPEIKIDRDQIEDTCLGCPYCGNPATSNYGCCGESSSHFEKMYMFEDEWYLESDVEVVG